MTVIILVILEYLGMLRSDPFIRTDRISLMEIVERRVGY